jgi:hypothetical protein
LPRTKAISWSSKVETIDGTIAAAESNMWSDGILLAVGYFTLVPHVSREGARRDVIRHFGVDTMVSIPSSDCCGPSLQISSE